ncbi:hypothetical protein H7F51_11090 [Novosphingobium flavum]|uniref:Uncharacterized protein n=1 Tax=Novosphingobium flavum TaxID=1778672 RepID=A0A7X1FT87_9SPHN|nr:DNA sulfur modification protein DndB [Novosphingobium flavum]MBC2666062.1 hypothetical protein [Novosphingobium flavum]
MFGNTDGMPKHMLSDEAEGKLTSLSSMLDLGTDEEPVNVLMGYNLGNPTWCADVKLATFVEWSEIANDPDKGDIAQRRLDPNHAKSLASFMLKGLINAAIVRRMLQGKPVPHIYAEVQGRLGTKPYCALQPVVANIRAIDPNSPSIRAERGVTRSGETVGFKVFMPRTYRWWVVDGQHRRFGGEMLMDWLKEVTRTGRYPGRGGIIDFKGDIDDDEMLVWVEALECARTFATVKIEFHLGLTTDQERQLFHDLNNLGKKINVSQATEFDQGNPINNFVRVELEDGIGIVTTERDVKDWGKDDGSLLRKDLAGINAIAFLNKTNARTATPLVISERKEDIARLWESISNIPGFGEDKAKVKTVASQPVVLKALAKLAFDLLYSNRRPENGRDLYDRLVSNLDDVNFSHDNRMWRYYQMTEEERNHPEISGLAAFLPDSGLVTPDSNRDLGAYQGGLMRFGAKHNDIYPILADMIRWKMHLPNRHSPSENDQPGTQRRGLPVDGTDCRFTYGGRDYVGKIADGLLVVEGFGDGFKSFSAASHAVTQTSRNGWLDWHLKDATGSWVLADDWRHQFD